MGFSIAIDDFGTGVRLREYPIDRLKIDRVFIQRLQSCEEDRAIVSAIISMARTLQLDVVAEWVEALCQLLVLQEEQCSLAQRLLLGRPLPATDAIDLLRRRSANPDENRRSA